MTTVKLVLKPPDDDSKNWDKGLFTQQVTIKL